MEIRLGNPLSSEKILVITHIAKPINQKFKITFLFISFITFLHLLNPSELLGRIIGKINYWGELLGKLIIGLIESP